MKICIFAHDAYMSGANMSLRDWVSEDNKDEIFIFIPHKSSDFTGWKSNVHIIAGNYFVITKSLIPTSFASKIKTSVKKTYMFLFYRSIIKKKIQKEVKKIDPDIIISNSFSIWLGADIAKTLNIPHIWHIREFMELDHSITHLNQKHIKELAKNSNAIYISQSIKKYYDNKYDFLSTKVIYNHVDYNPSLVSSKKRFSSDKTKMLFVGTLQEGKGIWDAIHAVRRLSNKGYDLQLDIYGDGPLRTSIIEYLNKNKIQNIRLMGYTTDLPLKRKDYDMELVCSKMEALGRVTIEAMYYRNLVIGSNSAGTKEIITDKKTGFLYKVNDVKDLEEKIVNVVDSKDKQKSIEEIIVKAHEFAVENFSKPITSKILSFIKEIV